MKIIHFSDPHGGGPAEDWMAYFDKRWVGVFNYRFRRRFRHDLSKLQTAVEYILDVKPDAAVCTGDLTSAGQPGEFARVIEILKPLRNSKIPFIYTPGNHDCYVTRPQCVKAVKDAVEYLSHGVYTFEGMPLKLEVGEVDFLVVNTSAPSNLLCSWGFLTAENRDFIVKNCAEDNHERPRILVTHYPMIEEHPVLRVRHRLFGQKEVLKLMKNKQLDLVLCGHVHKPSLRVDEQGRGECISGSVTRNGTMMEIEYEKAARKFSFRTIGV
ncbi:MAG: metallophosphoesterase [Lentisphaeria bacterium]|nr:metallophosphoesterase [Lentisphaeria bacterium]